MVVGPPVEIFRTVSRALILLCISQIILYPVGGERGNAGNDICSKGSSCIPLDDCLKANRVQKCGLGRFCCKGLENKEINNLKGLEEQKGKNGQKHNKLLSKRKKKNGIKIKQKSKSRKLNKNYNLLVKRKKSKGPKGNKDKTKPKTNCSTTTAACKAAGGTCSRKGSCPRKYKSNKSIGRKSKSKGNKKGNGSRKTKKVKGKTSLCGLFCECCLPKPCANKPSTPACNKRGGTCKMRAGCDKKKNIITDECDGRRNECFECCSPKGGPDDSVCRVPKGKCKKFGGKCIKKGDPCSFDRFQNGCKRKGGCECCADIPKPCPKKCKCNNSEKGKCRKTCKGNEEDLQVGCSWKKKPCDGCKCCAKKSTCDPKTCTLNNIQGKCSEKPIDGYTDKGSQQCKGSCKCYIKNESTCDPKTCTFNNIQGKCSETPIDGYTDKGSQQCKGSCKCYIKDATTTQPPTTTTQPPTTTTTNPPTTSTTEPPSSTTRPSNLQPDECPVIDTRSLPKIDKKVKFIPRPPLTEEEIMAAVANKFVPNKTSIRLPCSSVFRQTDSTNRGVVRPNWPNAEIPYELDINFNKTQENLIINAMEEIMNKTCIKFPVYTNQTFWMRIRLGALDTGCNAHIGIEYEPPNIINLEDPGCMYHGTIVHEILHVAGLAHEQSRLDRDNYVSILWENIEEGWAYAFCKDNTIDTGHPYDYASIMQYGPYAFSREEDVLKTIDSRGNAIGLREEMSKGDVEQVYYIYCSKSYECNAEFPQKDDSKKKYCFIEDEMSWFSGLAYCQKLGAGAQLAILNTESKRTEVAAYLETKKADYAWVGASDRSGAFQWLNGNPVTNDSWYTDTNNFSTIPTPDGNKNTSVVTSRFSPPKTLFAYAFNYHIPVLCEY